MIRKFTQKESPQLAKWLAEEETALPGYMAALQIMTDMQVIAKLSKVPDFILARYAKTPMENVLTRWKRNDNQWIRELLSRNHRMSFHIFLERGYMALLIKLHPNRTVESKDGVRVMLRSDQHETSQIAMAYEIEP